jgi:hypothetical protein
MKSDKNYKDILFKNFNCFKSRLVSDINYKDLKESKTKRINKLIEMLREIHNILETVFLFFCLSFIYFICLVY